MYELMERSMVVSARVDARALAVVARYIMDAGQYPKSKSNVVGQAMKIVANSIVEQQPELAIESVEHAYTALVRMGLAPASKQAMQAIGRSMSIESSLNVNNGELADMNSIEKRVTRMYAGQGYGGPELREKVNEEMSRMTSHANQHMGQGSDEDPEESLKNKTDDMALEALKKLGHSDEEIEAARQALEDTKVQRAQIVRDERLASQADQITRVKATAVNGIIDTRGGAAPRQTTGESLDVTDPQYKEKRLAREKAKSDEMKAALSGPPS